MPQAARSARLLALAAMLFPAVAFAAWTPGGVPLTSASFSYGHSVVADGQGGVLVYWLGLDGTYGVYASRVLSDGTPSASLPLAGARVGSPTLWTPFMDATLAGGDLFVAAYNPFLNAPNHSVQMFRVHADGTTAPGWPDSGRRVVSTFRSIVPRFDADGTGGLAMAYFSRQPDPITFPLTSVFDLFALRVTGGGLLAPGWPFNGIAVSQPLPGTAPVLINAAIEVAHDGAGGMFVAWQDSADGVGDLHVQHLDGAGNLAPGWAPDGRTVCSVSSLKHQLHLAADGAGGVYVAWSEHRGPDFAAFLTRIMDNGANAPGWPAAGLQVTAPGVAATLGHMVADGTGGAIVGTLEYRDNVQSDVYARRYLPGGAVAPGWAGGALVVANPSGDDLASLLPTGAGGAFFLAGSAVGAATDHDGLTAYALDGAGAPAAGFPVAGLPITLAHVTEAKLIPAEPGAAIATWRQDGTPIDLRGLKFEIGVPTAARASLVSASAEPGRVWIEWQLSDAEVPDVAIERRAPAGTWVEVGHAAVNGAGRVVFEDDDAPTGGVGYRMAVASPAGIQRLGETEVSVPAPFGFALGVTPNPALHGRFAVQLTLPVAAQSSLEVIDVGGRMIRRDVQTLAAGTHVREIGGVLAPGVYLVRLTQGERIAVCRAVVIE